MSENQQPLSDLEVKEEKNFNELSFQMQNR